MSIVPPARNFPSGAYGGGGFYQQPQANRRVLAAGVMPNALTTLYTVPKRTTVEITSFHAHNYTAGSVNLDFYVRQDGGTAYNWYSVTLTAGANISQQNNFGNARIMLGPGWELRAVADTATAVDYLITGIEWFLPTGGAVS